MAGIELRDFQKDCVAHLRSGKVLAAGVGAGKSIMSLYWYVTTQCKVVESSNKQGKLFRIKKGSPDLVIITTAKKRNSHEWDDELFKFALKVGENSDKMGGVHVAVDSWNNITKYVKAPKNTVFIFDEQRAIGKGAWSKAFIAIARKHPWIMLSATPADDWKDWCPVFVADGFYRTQTEFFRRHAVYSRYTTYPRIDRWVETKLLERCRDKVLLTCEVPRKTVHHDIVLECDYDKKRVKYAMKERQDMDTGEPFMNASQLTYYLRRVINCDRSRIDMCKEAVADHSRVIIFYSLKAELDAIIQLGDEMGVPVYQYNGQVHDEVPDKPEWIYAVQYNAGSEGWNCISCNTMIFWDLSYSYRQMVQASGRIDRLNTPYKNLYYYYCRSHAPIDIAIIRALKNKKDFNASAFWKGLNKK